MMWRLAAHGTRPGNPHGVLKVWSVVEWLTDHAWNLSPIPGAPHGFLRIRAVRYRGRPVVLPDSTEIQRGTLIAELHINNDAMLDFMSRKEMNLFKACREDMRSLAAWIERADPHGEIGAFCGFTLLGPVAARLGFWRHERRMRVKSRLDRMFMHGLLMMYSVDGLGRISRGQHMLSYPEEVWISRRELMRRYGSESIRAAPVSVAATPQHEGHQAGANP